MYQQDGRLDVHAALRHPWLERADKSYSNEYRISSKYLSDYYKLYRFVYYISVAQHAFAVVRQFSILII